MSQPDNDLDTIEDLFNLTTARSTYSQDYNLRRRYRNTAGPIMLFLILIIYVLFQTCTVFHIRRSVYMQAIHVTQFLIL